MDIEGGRDARPAAAAEPSAAPGEAGGALPRPASFETVLGIRFYAGTAAGAVAAGLAGGLVVVPSAPVLVRAADDPALAAALRAAAVALPDSGFMVLLWRLRGGRKLRRISGLEYLKLLLAQPAARAPGALFWVMPNERALARNRAWLESVGVPVADADCYLAPRYGDGPLADEALAAALRRRRPRHVILGIGGGVQERLGLYLQRALDWRPGIHCIGAAIGFLSGDQVRIPMWADAIYLGWLVRCVAAPRRYVPRYLAAARLAILMLR